MTYLFAVLFRPVRHQPFDFRSEFLRDFFALDIHDVWGSTGATLELIPCSPSQRHCPSIDAQVAEILPSGGNGTNKKVIPWHECRRCPKPQVLCILYWDNSGGGMDELDYWRLCDEVSVVQAALLIVGEDPSERQNYIEREHNKPSGYDAVRAALANAIKGNRLPAHISRGDDQFGMTVSTDIKPLS